MDHLIWSKPLVAAALLALLWTLESAAPIDPGRHRRLQHGLTNLGMGLINALAVSMPAAGLLYGVTEWARVANFGLTRWIGVPAWMAWVAVLMAFDVWMYWWHRFNHRISWLWRFHAVHHSDWELDATSAVRFHPGEIIFSTLARLVVLPVLGMTLPQLFVYETLLLPVVLFHHSNVRVPRVMDAGLRWLIVTPRMHWVHHSQERWEADSNYSVVLSIWDRLFGTYQFRPNPESLRLGLHDEDGGLRSRTFKEVLSAPFLSPIRRCNLGEAARGVQDAVMSRASKGDRADCASRAGYSEG